MALLAMKRFQGDVCCGLDPDPCTILKACYRKQAHSIVVSRVLPRL